MSEAADEAGLPLSEWLSQAAEAKINADGDAKSSRRQSASVAAGTP